MGGCRSHILLLAALPLLTHADHASTVSGVLCNHAPYWTVGADVYVVEGSGAYTYPGRRWSPMIHDGQPSIPGGTAGAPGACPVGTMRDPTGGSGPCCLDSTADVMCGMGTVCPLLVPQNECSCRQDLQFAVTATPNLFCDGPRIVPCWPEWDNPACPMNPAGHCNDPGDQNTADLQFTPCPCAFGTSVVCVTLCDDEHLTGDFLGVPNGCNDDNCAPTQCFTIHIEQRNNCPTWDAVTTLTANEDVVQCRRFANNVSPGCTNEGHNQAHQQDLHWKWSCTNDALFAKMPHVIYHQGDTTADLCYTPTPDMSGCSTCTITLHDTGGTANGGCDQSPPKVVNICINEINDPPSFIPGPTTITVDEDAANSCNPSGCSSSTWSYSNWASNRKIGPGWEVCARTGTCCQSSACNPRQVLTNFDISFSDACDQDLFEELPRIDVLTGDLSFTLAHHANTPGSRTVELDITLHDSGADSGACLLVNDPACHQSHSGTVRLTLIIQPENDHPSFVPAFPSLTLIEDELFPATVWAADMCIGGWEAGFCADQDCKGAGNCPDVAPGTCCPTPGAATCKCDYCNEQQGPEGQSFVWDVSVDNVALFTAAGQPSISDAGVLTFTLATDVNGVARVRATLKDDGGNFDNPAVGNTEELLVTVLPKNDQPQFTVTASYSTTVCSPCDQVVVGQFVTFIDTGSTWTDEDVQTLQWVSNTPAVNNDNPALFKEQPVLLFSTDGTTADLHFTANEGVSGTATVRVTLKDSGDDAGCAAAPVTGDCVCNGGAAVPRRQSCNTLTQEFTITIGNTNLPPSFTIGHSGAVETIEDPVPGTVAVGGFSTHTAGSSVEDTTQVVSYIVDAADTSLFAAGGQPAIDASGTLTYTPAPDANGKTLLSVRARDNGAPPLTTEVQTMELIIHPVNDAPTLTHEPNLPPPPGPAAHDMCTLDEGCAYSVSFSSGLSLGPADEEAVQDVLKAAVTCPSHPTLLRSVVFVPATGELSLILNKDQHTLGVPSVCTVTVQDNGGRDLGGQDTYTGSVTLTVNSDDPPPEFVVGVGAVMKEDDPVEVFRQGILTITSGTPLTGTCTGTLVAACSVNVVNGDVTVDLEREMNGNEDLVIRLCNSGGCTDNAFPLHVVPVNDAPIIDSLTNVVVREALGVTSETVPTAVEVRDLGDGSYFYRIPVASAYAGPNSTAGPSESEQQVTFRVSTSSSLFAVPPSMDSHGVLSFTTNGVGVATLTVTAKDDGGRANGGVDTSVARVLTVDVGRFNTAPTFEILKPAVTASEAPDTSTVHRVDAFVDSMKPGTYPSEAEQQVASSVVCPTCTLFAPTSYVTSAGQLVLHLNKDRFTPPEGCQCSVVLSDDGPQGGGHRHVSDAKNFTVIIPNDNDPPAFVIGPNQVTTVNQTLSAPLWVDPSTISAGPYEDYQVLRFETSFDESLLSSVKVDLDGDLTVVPRGGKTGVATVELCLVDGEGGKTCDDFLVNVLPNGVVGLPVFDTAGHVTVDEDTPPYSGQWATNARSGDPTDATRSLSGYRVRVLNGADIFSPSNMPTVAANNMLTFGLAPDMNGVANVEVTLEEVNGVTSLPQQLVITVRPVNDPPSFAPGTDVTVFEDSLPHGGAWCTDASAGPYEDTDTLVFEVTARDPTLFVVLPSLTAGCVLSFEVAADRYGDTVVDVVLKDDEHTTTVVHFGIQVTPVNDAPTWNVPVETLYLSEDFGTAKRVVGDTILPGGLDEGGQTMQVEVEVLSGAELFTSPVVASVDGGGAALTFVSAEDRHGAAVLRLTLRDTGGTTGGGVDAAEPRQLVVSVRGINDPPYFEAPETLTIYEDTPVTLPEWVTSATPGAHEDQGLVWGGGTGTMLTISVLDNTTLHATVQANTFGEGVVTLQVEDRDTEDPSFRALRYERDVRYTVVPVNDRPEFSLATGSVVGHVGEYAARVVSEATPGPPNEAGQQVTFEVVAEDASLFTVQPQVTSEGVLVFTAGRVGETSLRIVAVDDGGVAGGGFDRTVEQVLAVVVAGVGGPGFEHSGEVTTTPGGYTARWVTGVSNATGVPVYTVLPVSGGELFDEGPQVSSSGVLTFTTKPEATGRAVYNVTLGTGETHTLAINVLPGSSVVQLISYMPPGEVDPAVWVDTIAAYLGVGSGEVEVVSVGEDKTAKTVGGSSVLVRVSGYDVRDRLVAGSNEVNAMSSALRLYDVAEAGCAVVEGDACFPEMVCSEHSAEQGCASKSSCRWSALNQCTSICAHLAQAQCTATPTSCVWDGLLCHSLCPTLTQSLCLTTPRCTYDTTCTEAAPSPSSSSLPPWVIPLAVTGGILSAAGLLALAVYRSQSDEPNKPPPSPEAPPSTTHEEWYGQGHPLNPIEQTFSSPSHPATVAH